MRTRMKLLNSLLDELSKNGIYEDDIDKIVMNRDMLSIEFYVCYSPSMLVAFKRIFGLKFELDHKGILQLVNTKYYKEDPYILRVYLT